jgi:hypothetical protein
MNTHIQSYYMATSTGTTNTTSTPTISHGTVLSRTHTRINMWHSSTVMHTFPTSTTGIHIDEVNPFGLP